MWVGVIYYSQATNTKQGGLPTRIPTPPPLRTPIGRLGVIYDSQPTRIHKKTTTNRWILLLSYMKKLSKQPKTCNKIEFKHIL